MNVKLVVLGLLMEKDRHPYEVQQLLTTTHMKYYMKITKGSLYYAFEQLEKHHFIEVKNTIQDEHRVGRTIYTITSEGQLEFEKLLSEQITKRDEAPLPLYEALLFAVHGDPNEIITQLEVKLEQTKQSLRIMQNVYKSKYKKEHMATVYIIVSVIMHLQTDLHILEHLIEDTKINGLASKGTDILMKLTDGFMDD
ncbi:PadR family transcriptional regulator [Ectobacillus sp. sgz5001026]|uniref:PadR family transcriptional regulator n=1 Tax=Ectobacillus sp. sgz5001026 TaxID=3242473 RepID=UPI0036D25F38